MLMLICLFCFFTFHLLPSTMPTTDTKVLTKIVCFGQRLTLICRSGTSLEIQGAAIKMSSSLSECRKYRRRNPGCESPGQVTEVIQSMCNGKDECSLGYGTANRRTSSLDCHATTMYFKNTYFNISYKCTSSLIVGPTAHGGVVIDDKKTTTDDSDSLYFSLLRLFIDMHLAGEYIGTHSLWFILCIASSFCIGVLVLIIYALLFKFFCHTKRHNRHEPLPQTERSGLEIIPTASPATQSDHTEELVISSHTDSSSIQNSSSNVQTNQMITDVPELRYQIPGGSHTSVDEETQTVSNSTQDVAEPKRKLTATEIEELGSLVADLNMYDMMMDDPFELVDGPMRGTRHGDYDNISEIYDNAADSSGDMFSKSSNVSTIENKLSKYDKYLSPFPTSKNTSLHHSTTSVTNGSLQSQARARRVSETSSHETSISADIGYRDAGSHNKPCPTSLQNQPEFPIYATLNSKNKCATAIAPLTESIGTLNRNNARIRSDDHNPPLDIRYMFGNESRPKPSSTLQRDRSRYPYDLPYEPYHCNKPQSEPSSTPRIDSRRFPLDTSRTTCLAIDRDQSNSLRRMGFYPTQKSSDNNSSCTSQDGSYSGKSSRKCSRSPPSEKSICFQTDSMHHTNGTGRTQTSTNNDRSPNYLIEQLYDPNPSPCTSKKNYSREFQREPFASPFSRGSSSSSSVNRPFPVETPFDKNTSVNERGLHHTSRNTKQLNGTPENDHRMCPSETTYDIKTPVGLKEGLYTNGHKASPIGTPRNELRRFPSELSYETGNSSDEHTFKELSSSSPYMARDSSADRGTSMQGKSKMGVRGDGFDYIVGNARPK